MAATKYGVGCKAIKAGAVGATGGMGTTLTDVGAPYKGTVSIIDADGTVTKHLAENSKFPFLAVLDGAGTQVKFTLANILPTTLTQWLGGTVATDTWSAPVQSFSIEQSVSIDTLFGATIKIVRLFMYCKMTWNMSRTEIAKLEITGEVMQPDDPLAAPITIGPSV